MFEVVITDVFDPKVVHTKVEPDEAGEVLPKAGTVGLFKVFTACKAFFEKFVC